MRSSSIAGFAIISQDGMLADAHAEMPDSLKFEADQRFFERGLDAVDVVVHGRHSKEQFARSHLRQRLILTRRTPALAPHPTNPKALYWNPAGASFGEALAALEAPHSKIGVIGGTEVFDLFLDLFDVFHLTRVPGVLLPAGRPVFSAVPSRRPEAVLAEHGMQPGPLRTLDAAHRLTLVSWTRG